MALMVRKSRLIVLGLAGAGARTGVRFGTTGQANGIS
jgi:hypothetical protein